MNMLHGLIAYVGYILCKCFIVHDLENRSWSYSHLWIYRGDIFQHRLRGEEGDSEGRHNASRGAQQRVEGEERAVLAFAAACFCLILSCCVLCCESVKLWRCLLKEGKSCTLCMLLLLLLLCMAKRKSEIQRKQPWFSYGSSLLSFGLQSKLLTLKFEFMR